MICGSLVVRIDAARRPITIHRTTITPLGYIPGAHHRILRSLSLSFRSSDARPRHFRYTYTPALLQIATSTSPLHLLLLTWRKKSRPRFRSSSYPLDGPVTPAGEREDCLDLYIYTYTHTRVIWFTRAIGSVISLRIQNRIYQTAKICFSEFFSRHVWYGNLLGSAELVPTNSTIGSIRRLRSNLISQRVITTRIRGQLRGNTPPSCTKFVNVVGVCGSVSNARCLAYIANERTDGWETKCVSLCKFVRVRAYKRQTEERERERFDRVQIGNNEDRQGERAQERQHKVCQTTDPLFVVVRLPSTSIDPLWSPNCPCLESFWRTS